MVRSPPDFSPSLISAASLRVIWVPNPTSPVSVEIPATFKLSDILTPVFVVSKRLLLLWKISTDELLYARI